jgi:ribosomal protein S18 acetylase RimI-like enzyme
VDVTRDGVDFRAAGPADQDFLGAMLWLAHEWRHGGPPPADAIGALPARVRRYAAAFGRPGDFGVLALIGGVAVGASWGRLFTPEDGSYGFVAADVPELTLAVRPEARRRGVATGLLGRVVAAADGRSLPALSLSVEPDNPALRLYRRHGFRKVGEVEGSWTMVRRRGDDGPA